MLRIFILIISKMASPSTYKNYNSQEFFGDAFNEAKIIDTGYARI